MPGTARLFCYYSYRNASNAIDWLIQAFGFEHVRQQDGADGAVLHAELRLGDVVIMVASAGADYIMPPLVGRSTGHGAYLLVDDVEGIYARALASGATAIVKPETIEWGTRRCRMLDPEGYEWSFGAYERAQVGEVYPSHTTPHLYHSYPSGQIGERVTGDSDEL